MEQEILSLESIRNLQFIQDYKRMKSGYTKKHQYTNFVATNSPVTILQDVVRKTSHQSDEDVGLLKEHIERLELLKSYIKNWEISRNPEIEISPIKDCTQKPSDKSETFYSIDKVIKNIQENVLCRKLL